MDKGNLGIMAFVGLLVAFGVAGYFVVPRLMSPEPETVGVVAPATPSPAAGILSVPATSSKPEGPAAPASGETAAPAATDGGTAPPPATEVANVDPKTSRLADPDLWVKPSFDVLRVEPDGSTVIAGKAEPGTRLDLMNGQSVVASTNVGPSGDFAAVLDAPLAPGDYQLTLRIMGENAVSKLSDEVATVSIPKDATGQLLAMVTTPGAASRILAQPSVEAGNAEPNAAQAPSDPAQPASEPATPAAEAVNTEGKTDRVTVASDAPVLPDLPAGAAQLSGTAPDVATPAAGPETELASAPPQTAPAATVLPAGATVRVDAVEIEGDKIFIAGSATPGYKVQVAADGKLVGSDTADGNGRFIVEAVSPLSVGDHVISAELFAPDGQSALLRATVPFNRPPGETLAAVAPADPQPAPTEGAPATGQAAPVAQPVAVSQAAGEAAEVPADSSQGALALPDLEDLAAMREDAVTALSTLEALVADASPPPIEDFVRARDEAAAKLKAVAEAALPDAMPADTMAAAQGIKDQAAAALAAVAPARSGERVDLSDPAALQAARDNVDAAVSSLASVPAKQPAALEASAPAETGPATIQQAPLTPSAQAVIIRRGDTLWQISRRTYGQGVRYTTIYLANRSQIQNPDRIKPGQVFSVPTKALDNAEDLHRQRLEGTTVN